ncbi:receptor-type tyrosine-protein phosphatase C isoform X3 [Gadus morhua]|uniref:receptor-type tyrosine-protein phosphatase C isoform X3 n=1 Tax=Gadus morhua TaxID=8049 RepID=UPI0011B4FFBE|nr:receptor-type tyrosine-protein phosphatase C isoform X3 [Gadus morhua]
MAGLDGLRVLLLLAGLVAMANCQVNPNGQVTPTVKPTTPTGQVNPTDQSTTVSPSRTAVPTSSTAVPTSSNATSPSSNATSPSSTAVLPTSTAVLPASTASSPSSNASSPSTNSSSPSTNSSSPSTNASSPSTNSSSPASTASSPLKTSTPNPSSLPQTAATQTSVPTATTGPPPPLCNYSGEAYKTGFLLTFENVTEGNYSIELTKRSTNESNKVTVALSGTNQTHLLQYLKPSTNYTVHISPSKHLTVTCGRNLELKTNGINQDEIVELPTDSYQDICYETEWNIWNTVFNVSSKKYKFCIKPKYTDLCTNLTTPLNSYPPLNFTKWISLEYLNPDNIKLEVPNKLPAEINWKNQMDLKCEGLGINFTCEGPDKKKYKLDKLEPYTKYTCTGVLYNLHNKTIAIEKRVTKEVNITCDLELKVTDTPSKESVKFKWNASSKHCPNLSQHNDLSYNCSCVGKDKARYTPSSKERSCEVTGLLPYTKYNCKIQPRFNDKPIGRPHGEGHICTSAGVPKNVTIKRTTQVENNAFQVECTDLIEGDWRGPKGSYHATITPGVHKKMQNRSCFFQFGDLSYSTGYTVSIVAFNGVNSGKALIVKLQTSYNDRVLIGFLVFLILLTALALSFVLYKIYILQRKKTHQDDGLLLTPQTNEEDQLMHLEPIGAEVLLDVYKKKIADEGRLFLAEFQSVPRIFSRNTMKEAKRSYNAVKNRYVDILPYDYNRVQLTSGNGEHGCDYINASFINGFQEPKKYIAAQGPKDETVASFWRMTWEQKSSIIVMVTRCEEGNRVKCAQYWPSTTSTPEVFEEFEVKLNKEEQCPDYIIRLLTLSNKRDNTEREVTQIQFTSWPDHGVPEDPQLLLKLRKRVNAFKNLFSGPIVIHCSAGVGRTGTYISIDAMMESLESERRMDIYGYIVNLRKQRCLMVQVETQYILIHQAMIEHNEFGETEIGLSEFHSTLSVLQETGSGVETSLLQDEFKRLPKYNNRRTCNTGLAEENQKKNRSSVLPYDYNRVFVKIEEDHNEPEDRVYEEEDETASSSEEDEDSMKYINASHIDGYWGSGSLITAQSPLVNSTADFWLMVFQKRAAAIVNLSDGTQGDSECSPYWGQEKTKFEDIEVEVTETECTPVFTVRTMQIYHTKRKESRQVKQFHFLQWPTQNLPESGGLLTDMIRSVKQTCGCSTGPLEGRGPVVVHCSDGSRQCGVFCALWNLLDSAQTERMVDVFQIAKAQRRQRQGMISSVEQYQFLYEALAAAYPVQNGSVTAAPVTVAAGDAVHIIDETGRTQEPAGITADGQQEEAASTPLIQKEEKEEKEEKEAADNGSTVTLEV